MSPDPPVLGKPLTVQVSGVLDEDVTTASIDLDLNVGALALFHSKIKANIPWSTNPVVLRKGPIHVDVGPVVLPWAPGTTTIVGRIRGVTGSGEPVMCVDLDVTVGGASALPLAMLNATSPALPLGQGLTSCNKPTDHVTNFDLVVNSGGVTATGNLDEDLSGFTIDLDAKIKKFFVHIPLKASIPVFLSPPLPKGDFKVAVGPASGHLSPDLGITVVGQAAVSDRRREEVLCLEFDQVLEESAGGEIVV